jgi:hypothetical protein
MTALGCCPLSADHMKRALVLFGSYRNGFVRGRERALSPCEAAVERAGSDENGSVRWLRGGDGNFGAMDARTLARLRALLGKGGRREARKNAEASVVRWIRATGDAFDLLPLERDRLGITGHRGEILTAARPGAWTFGFDRNDRPRVVRGDAVEKLVDGPLARQYHRDAPSP